MLARQEQGKSQESIFSPGAKQVAAVISREEATYLNNNFVGTEHMLLALLTAAQEKTIAPIFDTLNLDIEKIRQQVWFVAGRGEKPVTGDINYYTPRAITAATLAIEEFRNSGTREINAIHLIIGLVREREGIAASVLVENGIGYSQLEKLRELAKKSEDPEVSKEETENDRSIKSLNRLKNRIAQDPTLGDKAKTDSLVMVDTQIQLKQEIPFSKSYLAVMQQAEDRARGLNHISIHEEDIFWALLQEKTCTQVLNNMGIISDRVRLCVENIVKPDKDPLPENRQIEPSDILKKSINRAVKTVQTKGLREITPSILLREVLGSNGIARALLLIATDKSRINLPLLTTSVLKLNRA